MALASGQPGLDVPHTEADVSPQQHLLLLFRLPHGPHRSREVPGSLSPCHLSPDYGHKLQEAKVSRGRQ